MILRLEPMKDPLWIEEIEEMGPCSIGAVWGGPTESKPHHCHTNQDWNCFKALNVQKYWMDSSFKSNVQPILCTSNNYPIFVPSKRWPHPAVSAHLDIIFQSFSKLRHGKNSPSVDGTIWISCIHELFGKFTSKKMSCSISGPHFLNVISKKNFKKMNGW